MCCTVCKYFANWLPLDTILLRPSEFVLDLQLMATEVFQHDTFNDSSMYDSQSWMKNDDHTVFVKESSQIVAYRYAQWDPTWLPVYSFTKKSQSHTRPNTTSILSCISVYQSITRTKREQTKHCLASPAKYR